MARRFNREDCVIRTAYCGNGAVPRDTLNKKYSRAGTREECLKKGIGVGSAQERAKKIPKNSLQQITYIGPVYEANFKAQRVGNLTQLKTVVASKENKRQFIERCCTRKSGGVDQRAVNAVLMYLHDSGVRELPRCRVIRE